MKSKYIIPVLIGMMLVAMITPAFATRYTSGPTQSYVNSYNNIGWYGSFSDPQNVDVSAGDDFTWYNWWYVGDTAYQGTHTVSVLDQVQGNWETPYNLDSSARCSYGLTYGQSMAVDAQSMDYSSGGSGTFNRYHKSVYNGNPSSTTTRVVTVI